MKKAAQIEVVEGELRMIDGSDLREHMKDWQEHNQIPDNTPVRILTQEAFQELTALATMAGIA